MFPTCSVPPSGSLGGPGTKMSEHLHPGLHPDADSLSAFIEGALPEHERRQCLAHFAECSRCREIAFLTLEPPPAPAASKPAPAWRRWFAPVPLLSAAAAACIVVLAVSLYLHYTARRPAPGGVASARQSPPTPAPPSPEIRTEARIPANPARIKRFALGSISATARTIAPPDLPPPPTIPAQSNSAAQALPSAAPLPAIFASVNSLSEITGTVTDATGAAIPAATVTLRQLAGTVIGNVRTDVMGQFRLSGLPAGHYELQITAAGFRSTSRQIDLQPRELASVRSEMAIGSVSETVEVTAAVPSVQTSSQTSTTRSAPRPLPSKLAATITVARSKVTLAVDSAGVLFISRNAGKRWKAVNPTWPGKVVRLVNLTEGFQLTTDSDSVWMSRDGSHWYPVKRN
jgi:hypothetical protein